MNITHQYSEPKKPPEVAAQPEFINYLQSEYLFVFNKTMMVDYCLSLIVLCWINSNPIWRKMIYVLTSSPDSDFVLLCTPPCSHTKGARGWWGYSESFVHLYWVGIIYNSYHIVIYSISLTYMNIWLTYLVRGICVGCIIIIANIYVGFFCLY